MIEEGETQGGVTGGLDPDDGKELKWEDTVVPSDDFSDDVSDARAGTDAKGSNGITSSYFVFALLGLLASVVAGFAYFQFVSPSGNGDKFESVPKVVLSGNAKTGSGLSDLEAPDRYLVSSSQLTSATNSPAPIYEHADILGYANSGPHAGGDTVILPASLHHSSSGAGGAQTKKMFSTEVADVVVLPVSVLSGNGHLAGVGVLSGHFSQPKYDAPGLAQKIDDKSVTGAGAEIGDLQQVDNLVSVPVLVSDEGKFVKPEVSVARAGAEHNDSQAAPSAGSHAPKDAAQEKQASVSTALQGTLASSNLSKHEVRPEGRLKKAVGNRVTGDAVAMKQITKTDIQRRRPYVLRSATAGSAWIEDVLSPGLLREVTIGDTIPEFGRVEEIVREGDGWVVVGKSAVLR